MTPQYPPSALPPFAESYPLERTPLEQMQSGVSEKKIRDTLDAYLSAHMAAATRLAHANAFEPDDNWEHA